MAQDVVVLRTGRLHEADLVANTLEERGIPFYRRFLSSSGVELAMPLSPVQGPGNWWLIVVPPSQADRAREVVGELPVSGEPNPGVWDFGPSPGSRRFFRGYAWVVLVVMAVWAVHSAWDFIAR